MICLTNIEYAQNPTWKSLMGLEAGDALFAFNEICWKSNHKFKYHYLSFFGTLVVLSNFFFAYHSISE